MAVTGDGGSNSAIDLANALTHLGDGIWRQWSFHIRAKYGSAPTGSNRVVFSLSDGASANYDAGYLWDHPTSTFRNAFFFKNGLGTYYTAQVALSTGAWNYISCVYDGNNITNRTNGTSATTAGVVGQPGVAPLMALFNVAGARTGGGFPGQIDCLTFWNAPLSTSDMAQLEAGVNPELIQPGNIVAHVQLTTNATLSDISGNGHNGSVRAGTFTTSTGPTIAAASDFVIRSPVATTILPGATTGNIGLVLNGTPSSSVSCAFSDGGAGGTFTPSSLSGIADPGVHTLTYTPPAGNATRIVTVTASGGITTSHTLAIKAFSPANVSNIALWLKADAGVYKDLGATLATNGQTVEQWNDQSGSGNNATQTTSGSRPTYNTNILNGLPALTFDGSSNYLTHGDLSEPACVIVVCSTDTYSSFGGLLSGDTSDAVADGAYSLQANSTAVANKYQRFFGRTLSGDTTTYPAWGVTAEASIFTFDILGIRNTGSSLSMYSYDTLLSTLAKPAGTLRPISTANIGMVPYSRSAGSFYDGYIFEIVKFSVNPSDADYQNCVDYLRQKWGLVPHGPYIMAAFSTDNDPFLKFYSSSDLTDFKVLPTNYVGPATHVSRDFDVIPYLGKYVFVTCNSAPSPPSGFIDHSNTFDVTTSSDMVTFTYQGSPDCSGAVGSGAHCGVFTPRFVRNADGSMYLDGGGLPHVLFGGTSDYSSLTADGIYEIHPNSADPTTWGTPANWSTPTQLTGTSLRAIMFDPFWIWDGSNFQGFYSYFDGSNHYIEQIRSAALTSSYTKIVTNDGFGFGSPYEHPALIKMANGNWRIFLDKVVAQGTYIADSIDNMATWGPLRPASVDGQIQSTSPRVVLQGGVVFQMPPSPPPPPPPGFGEDYVYFARHKGRR